MEFLTSNETAKRWNISARRIILLAKSGRIVGAEKVGKCWLIPKNAVKPLDGRTKDFKNGKKDSVVFRYPSLDFKGDAEFLPPLTDEEVRLKKAITAFHACEFLRADDELGDLFESAQNKYVQIYALYVSCMINMLLCKVDKFFKHYSLLSLKLESEFLHKQEMSSLLFEVDAIWGRQSGYNYDNIIKTNYNYDESFLPHLTMLGAVSAYFNIKNTTENELNLLEINCQLLKNSTCFAELQSIHLYLGGCYVILGMQEKADYHFSVALNIAEKYNLFYSVCDLYFYMRKAFEKALSCVMLQTKEKIEKLTDAIHKKYGEFYNMVALDSIFNLLPHKYYIYVFYANQGYTNKEVAMHLNTSEKYVAKVYSEIYDIAGLNSKAELVELYNKSTNAPAFDKWFLDGNKLG